MSDTRDELNRARHDGWQDFCRRPRRPRRPRLTDRVLRGILLIERRCGGPSERGEDPEAFCSVPEWDDAQVAIDWARAMKDWRKKQRKGKP